MLGLPEIVEILEEISLWSLQKEEILGHQVL